jgi:hypothetical protein
MKSKMPGFEKRKVAIDLYKHLTTLSLAAIAVIASFLQRLIELKDAQGLVALSAISFFSSVIFAVITCVILLANLEDLPEIHGTAIHNFFRFSAVISLTGFLLGASCLAWLVIRNVL